MPLFAMLRWLGGRCQWIMVAVELQLLMPLWWEASRDCAQMFFVVFAVQPFFCQHSVGSVFDGIGFLVAMCCPLQSLFIHMFDGFFFFI